MERVCKHHGVVSHRPRNGGGWRCTKCSTEAVGKTRRKIKQTLVNDHGGRCQNPDCAVPGGYDRHVAAFDFHHRDPAAKSFGIGFAGLTRSLARARAEASKCILLCANCHREIEAGEHQSWVAKLAAAPDC